VVSDDDITPVRCPAPSAGEGGGDLDELLQRLADPSPVAGLETFARGTLQPDGRLDLCKQDLSPLDAGRVIAAAVASPHTRHLLLGTNGLGAAGVAALAGALDDGHPLRTLYLGCNHVDADGVAQLADRLGADRTVRAVWLKRNPLGDAGVVALASALRRNSTVRTLDLTNTGFTVDGLRTLVSALGSRSIPLERLYLGGNNLGPTAVSLLVGLVRDGGVRELYLACGRLGDEGAAMLASAATEAGHPMTFGLGGNGIGPIGVSALAAALGSLSTLDLARPPSAVVLRAQSNVVGDEGASTLADALPGSGLRRLDLRHTGVTGRGARLLMAAAQQCTGLELLGLGSGVPRRIKRALTQTLSPATPPAADIQAIVSVYR
jgi:Ran GTPase-activating protein (RanGAP) involved in mRNA processing and transport